MGDGILKRERDANMRQKTVPIKSWVELETAFAAVQALPRGYPRMILVHGEPGLGKTTGVDRIHLKHGGVYMVASSTWSPRVLLEQLASRLGIPVTRRMRVSDILEAILDDIDAKRVPIIVIDEFDRVAHKNNIVELIREIYDIAEVPIALVGMGTIEKTLSDIPQFPQRIGERVHCRPIDLEDAGNIARGLCEVAMTDDLIREIWKRCGGIIRRILTELAHAEQVALRDGLDSVGVEQMRAK